MTTPLSVFTPATPTISTEVAADGGGWRIRCDKPRTFRLFEANDPGVEDCTVLYRAKLKTEGLTGKAYLEMWCRLPGRGEFFSRGLNNIATGSCDWTSHETPFFLKPGEKPDLIRLNLVVAATGLVFRKKVAGTIRLKDVELVRSPRDRS